MTSVRSKVLLGAVLWTFGMLAAFSVFLTFHLPIFDTLRIVHSHAYVMMALAVLSMIAGAAVVRSTLAPLQRIRRNLSTVRNGSAKRLSGAYPTEVQPLVDDLNALLEHREQMVTRAIAKAGDLAHGLKTPLAVLAQEAERAEAAGQTDLAASIGQQVERMRRQIDYHLAHARAAASGATSGARSSLAASTEGLSRTLLRLHAGRGIAIDDRVEPAHAVKCQREDLDEMLGNLLDNACKWARSRIAITSAQRDHVVSIVVDDDGPGLALSMREAVLQRGVRADEAAPGSGLGLAIVRDLAELYGGSIALAESPIGGLRATLELPQA
jgi:signal transduction histidine kinase